MIPNQFCHVKMPRGVEPCRFLSYTEVWGQPFAFVWVYGKRVLVRVELLCDAPKIVQRSMVGLIEGGE